MLNTVRRASLSDFVILYFESGKSLRKMFQPPKQRLLCDENCDTCAMSETKRACYTKNLIYKIVCNLCNAVYIGESCRCIKSRIKEHLSQDSSAVHQHFKNDHRQKPCISWSILHRGLNNTQKRRSLEAIYIGRHNGSLMNGCQGYYVDFKI